MDGENGENEEGEEKECCTKKNELSPGKEELPKDCNTIRTIDQILGDEDSDSSTKSWMLDDKFYEPDSSVTNGSDDEVPNTLANKLEELESEEESWKDETVAEIGSLVTTSLSIEEDRLAASAVVESKKKSELEDDASSDKNSELKSGNEKFHASDYSWSSYCNSDGERRTRRRRKMSIEDDLVHTSGSEDSICEVPISPKPQPPTVYLEDSSDESSSSSSSSSSETTDSETQSNRKSFLGRESGTKNNGNNSIISGSDGAANNPKGKDREEIITLSDDDVVMSEVVVETVRKKAVDKSVDRSAREKVGQRNGKEENLNQSSSNAGAKRFLSAIRQVGSKISDKNEASKTRENSAEDGELILNVAEGHASSSRIGNDNREEERLARRSAAAGHKRSIGESGRKSASDGSPAKRARNFEDGAVPGTSKDSYEESRDKTRNCAADSFFKPMTREMEKFYNDSWGGENFDVDAIRRRMPTDPKQWEISNEDLLNSQRRRSRYWTQMKCRNCNETGHAVAECTQQKKPPSCHMCGISGHREPRCPDKHCLGCGTKQKTYTQTCNGCRNTWCNGCQSRGHEDNNCPDLWRRYHQTTSLTDINTDLNRTGVMKPQHLLNCCNCARRGHDASTCASYRWSRHYPTPAYVTNYKTGPAYVYDPPPEAERPKSSKSEKLHANDNGDPCSSSSLISRDNINEKSKNKNENKKKSKQKKEGDEEEEKEDKEEEEDEDTDEITSGVVDNPDSIVANVEVERVEERSEVPDQSELKETDGRTEDSSIKSDTEIIEGDEITIHYSTTSARLNILYEKKTRLRTCMILLTEEEFEYLGSNDVGITFLENLLLRFPVGFKVRTVTDKYIGSSIEMLIESKPDVMYAIRLTIMGWLSLPVDERSRFVSLTLPRKKKDLVDILFKKLNELCEDLGDPKEICQDIRNLKSQLQSMRQQTKWGKTCGTSSKRARVVEELASLQCRLNMILVGQAQDKMAKKSYNYLRSSLIGMMKSYGESRVDDSVYLRIHHHYNKIFSAYTCDYYLWNWGSERERKIERRPPVYKSKNGQKKGSKKSVSSNITNEKNQNHSEEGMGKNIPSLVDPNVSFEKPDINQGRYFDCNIMKSRSPNPPSIRHDNGNIDVDMNTNYTGSYKPNENYRKTNNPTSSENYFQQSNKDFGSDNGSSRCKIQGRDDYQTTTGNNNIEEEDNISLTNNTDLKTSDRNNRDMFYLDNVAGCSSSKDYRSDCDTMIALGITSKKKKPARLPKTTDNNNKRNTCSKQKDKNANNNNNNNNNNTKNENKNKNKRKRNDSIALPLYLQERAVANVEQYLKMDDHAVVCAAARLKKKFNNKNITLRLISRFEKLLKRKTRIKVSLI